MKYCISIFILLFTVLSCEEFNSDCNVPTFRSYHQRICKYSQKYMLKCDTEIIIVRIWKLSSYGPTSLVEIPIGSSQIRYYQIDIIDDDKIRGGWIYSKNRNVTIRFFANDTLNLNYQRLRDELKKNQYKDTYSGEFINTSFYFQFVTKNEDNIYILPYNLVNKSYADSIIESIFTRISFLEAINYYQETQITSGIEQTYFNDSIRPLLMNRKDYLIDSAEVVPRIDKYWWL